MADSTQMKTGASSLESLGDFGTGSGFVVAPGSAGYAVLKTCPIAALPETWLDALNVFRKRGDAYQWANGTTRT